MRNDLPRAALAAALLAACGAAIACGYCVEDRVAAVYDHAAVESAVAQHRYVAFFSVDGNLATNEASRRALVAAVEKAGALKGSARVALANAALSAAYDPGKTTLAALTAAANRPLAPRGLTLAPLRVIDASGKLREP